MSTGSGVSKWIVCRLLLRPKGHIAMAVGQNHLGHWLSQAWKWIRSIEYLAIAGFMGTRHT